MLAIRCGRVEKKLRQWKKSTRLYPIDKDFVEDGVVRTTAKFPSVEEDDEGGTEKSIIVMTTARTVLASIC